MKKAADKVMKRSAISLEKRAAKPKPEYAVFLLAIIVVSLLGIYGYTIYRQGNTGAAANVAGNAITNPTFASATTQNIILQQPTSSQSGIESYVAIGNAPISNTFYRQGVANQPKYNGYIVEFKETPLVMQKVNLERAALRQKILGTQEGSQAVKAGLADQKSKIDSEHSNALYDIRSRISSGSATGGNLVGSAISAQPTGSISFKREYKNTFNGAAIDMSDSDADKVAQSPYVKKVYKNYQVKADLMDSVPQIHADQVWQMQDSQGRKLTGQNVTIAIIDSGIDYTHPDLGGCLGARCKVIGGYDFINNDADPMDDHGHGTHCAGIAAGNGALKGVAPDAKLLAYKVLDSNGEGGDDIVIEGIERAVDPNDDGSLSDHADVISLSLGGPGDPDDSVSTAIDNAVSSGVVAVVAAGNSGQDQQTIGSPGCARKAITVGAIDKQGVIAPFSSRGPVIWQNASGTQFMIKPDVVAPGVNICSAEYDSAWSDSKCLDDRHVAISGTSMATPHVAGAAALIKQAHPDWSPENVKAALESTAADIGERRTTEGYGEIDVKKAVSLASPPVLPQLQVYVNNVNNRFFDVLNMHDKFNITGIISGSYDSIRLSYKRKDSIIWSDNGFTVIGNGMLIGQFDPTVLSQGGLYQIRLNVTKGSYSAYDFLPVYFDKDLRGSSPFRLIPYNEGGGYTASISDIDNDSRNEIVFEQMYVPSIMNADGRQKYASVPIGMLLALDGSLPNFAIGDINNDGKKEIFSNQYDMNDPNFSPSYCFNYYNYDASVSKWHVACPVQNDVNHSMGYSPEALVNTGTLSDINKDGYLEYISLYNTHLNNTYGYTGNYYRRANIAIMDKSGKVLNYSRLDPGPNGDETFVAIGSLAVGDVDGDGSKEIVGQIQHDGTATNGAHTLGMDIYVWDSHLNVKKKISFENSGQFDYASPILADINNDSIMEIGLLLEDTMGSGQVQFYYFNGSLAWQYITHARYISEISFAAGDINKDGKPEIVFADIYHGPVTTNSTLYVLSSTGDLLWSRQLMGGVTVSPVLGDINNDSYPEIVVTTSYGILYAFDKDGNMIGGFPKYMDVNSQSGAALGDVDGDGLTEIVTASEISNIYVWKTNSTYNASNIPWPVFQHDDQHTGCYDCDKPLVFTCNDSLEKSNVDVPASVLSKYPSLKYYDPYTKSAVQRFRNGKPMSAPDYDQCVIDIFSGASWVTTSTNYCLNSDADNVTKKNCLLKERFCNDSTPIAYFHACGYGCSDGACLAPPHCSDSDGGINYTVKGTASFYQKGILNQWPDSCCVYNSTTKGCVNTPRSTDYLLERYCNGPSASGIAYKCPFACNNGACVNCVDTDGGLNYAVKGNATDSQGHGFVDQCMAVINGAYTTVNNCTRCTLYEAACNGDKVSNMGYDCLGLCKDGVCLP